jgi:hypothetical protein
MTIQPRMAFVTVMAMVLLGAGLATWQAQHDYRHGMAASKSRYIHSVDPFSNVSLASNP